MTTFNLSTLPKINCMKVFSLLLFGVFTLGFASCKKELTGSGTVITQVRPVTDFTSIVSNGDFQVTFKKANTCTVEVTGDDNVVEQVLTRVAGTRLVVEYKSEIKTHHHNPVSVSISMPDLENVELNGSGKISSDVLWLMPTCKATINGSGSVSLRINSDVLKASVSGSGKMVLAGESLTSAFLLSGSGSLQAFDLKSGKATVTKEGSGRLETFVTTTLAVSLKGSGNVYYKGNPGVTSTIEGSGKVIKS